MWTKVLKRPQSTRLKTQRKSSRGKSLLSKRELTSGSGESAAVHNAQMSLCSFSDETGKGDHDPAVVSTVEKLSVAGIDEPVSKQEKEARFTGGIPSQ
jgi:hypothetical protein